MAYSVDPARVADQVEAFSGFVLRHWNACVDQISLDPHPRDGQYTERGPYPPFSLRTYLFWITREKRVSGEDIFVFTAEFFPEYQLLFAVNEPELEVEIFYLRTMR